jgi:hypothetical protein
MRAVCANAPRRERHTRRCRSRFATYPKVSFPITHTHTKLLYGRSAWRCGLPLPLPLPCTSKSTNFKSLDLNYQKLTDPFACLGDKPFQRPLRRSASPWPIFRAKNTQMLLTVAHHYRTRDTFTYLAHR